MPLCDTIHTIVAKGFLGLPALIRLKLDRVGQNLQRRMGCAVRRLVRRSFSVDGSRSEKPLQSPIGGAAP